MRTGLIYSHQATDIPVINGKGDTKIGSLNSILYNIAHYGR